MQLEYEFEEIELHGPGILAWGTATLKPVKGHKGEFYVSEIAFKGGKALGREWAWTHSSLDCFAFRIVAHKIENSRDAEMAWVEYQQDVLCNG